jgi:ribosomal protein L37AE/L43A
MTTMIDNKECPKCGSEKIECKDDKFTCKYCGLYFRSFGGNT